MKGFFIIKTDKVLFHFRSLFGEKLILETKDLKSVIAITKSSKHIEMRFVIAYT
jgi:hypothetical protein